MSKALVPVEQKTVAFYEDEITAVLVDAGDGRTVVYIPIRPMVEHLGLDWSAQRRRINRDPVLADVVMSVAVTATDIKADSRRPRTSQVLAIPLDYLNGLLFGINASRVRDEIRDNLIRYQRDCYRVLADAFIDHAETAVMPTAGDDQVIMQLHNMALVIAATTKEMLETRRVAADNKSRLDRAAAFVGQMNQRLTDVERRIRTGDLTEEQAAEIKKRVNLIAQEMAKHTPGKSHFPAVYAALGEEAGVTSYKNISPKAFEAAAAFLDNWLESIKETK